MNLLATIQENLPLTIVLIVILAAIVATVIAMIVLGVKDKKRAKQEAEDAIDPFTESEPPYAEESAPVVEEAPAPVVEEPVAEPAKAEKPAPKAEKAPAKKATPKAEPAPKAKKAEPVKAEPAPAEEKNGSYNGKWIIGKSGEGFSFELRASNGERMLASGSYTTLAGAKKGIETYKTNIAKGNFKIVQTKTGDYIFQLLNGSGQLLGLGADYKTKTRCESAVESTKRFATTATVEVAEEEK